MREILKCSVVFFALVTISLFSSCKITINGNDDDDKKDEEVQITGERYVQVTAKGQKFYFYNESFSKGKKTGVIEIVDYKEDYARKFVEFKLTSTLGETIQETVMFNQLPNVDDEVQPCYLGLDGDVFKIYTLSEAIENHEKILFGMSTMPNADLDISLKNYMVYLASPTDLGDFRYEVQKRGETISKTLFGEE